MLLRQPAAVSASSSTQWAVPMLEGLVWSVGGSFASGLQPLCWMMQHEAPVKGKNPIYPQQSNTVSDQEPPIQNASMNSMNIMTRSTYIIILSLSCFKTNDNIGFQPRCWCLLSLLALQAAKPQNCELWKSLPGGLLGEANGGVNIWVNKLMDVTYDVTLLKTNMVIQKKIHSFQ